MCKLFEIDRQKKFKKPFTFSKFFQHFTIELTQVNWH